MSNRDQMNRFAENPVNVDISRSMFNRNHSVKFSANVGEVIPFLCEECLPGDTFSVDTSKVVRLQPLVAPIMDNLFLDTYYFFVPNRLIWEHWVNFMGETENLPWLDNVVYTVPQIKIPTGGFDVGTIADYLGIPPKAGANKTVSALPFRSYALICDQWFRDPNLMTPLAIPKDETTVTGVNTGDQVTDIAKGGKPFIASKYHDYFTSCLPQPQRGDLSQVEFGVHGLLPVNSYNQKAIESGQSVGSDKAPMRFLQYNAGGNYSIPSTGNVGITAGSSYAGAGSQNTTFSQNGAIAPANLFAELNVSIFDINQLRAAFAIQKYFEKSARSGPRYISFVKGFFGVDSPDARMQRAEYLGGNRLPLSIAEVTQTSATETGLTPQGNPVGMSATGDTNSDFTYSCTEHGWIMGVCVLRYNHTYQQGIERFWTRKTTFDFYNPVFANLGEMPVMKQEIYADAGAETVFGYQEAWADYRYRPSRVAGEMRSVATTSLDCWHLADNYAAAPTLSAGWIREDKSMLDRCLAVTSAVSNQYWCDFYIEEHAVRPMPLYSIPGLIDHH